MRGIFWWNWTVPPPPTNDGDYNPRGKLAEAVLRSWQGGSTSATLSVSKAGTGTGTVTSNPAGINCGAGCGTQSASFANGTSVSLAAAAAGGSTFAGWSGACTGTGGCTVSMTQARTVTATFTATPPTGNGGVTVAATTGGSPPWYFENRVSLANTAAVTAMTITVVVQRTPGISFNGLYNTVGSFQQSHTGNSNPAAITYTWTLSGQMGPGTGRLFVAQANGTGTPHPASGDRWTVTYTVGGQSYTQNGTF
jgi:hypothetical protein